MDQKINNHENQIKTLNSNIDQLRAQYDDRIYLIEKNMNSFKVNYQEKDSLIKQLKEEMTNLQNKIF